MGVLLSTPFLSSLNISLQKFLTFWMKRVIDSNVRGDDVACRIRMPMVGFGPFGE